MIVLENKSHDQISQGAFEIVVDSSDISFRATFESPATATTFQVYSCSNLPYWQLNSPILFLDHVTLGYHPITSHPELMTWAGQVAALVTKPLTKA